METDASNYTSEGDSVTWTASGGPITVTHAIVYRDRRWYERWFSWLWWPWRNSQVIAVLDFDGETSGAESTELAQYDLRVR